MPAQGLRLPVASRAGTSAALARTAVFSPCGRYRYSLTRTLRPRGRRLTFILLNPSTADASHDDPTIRRCIGFARRWRFATLTVVNLFAFRATHPRDLLRAADPIGPDNDAAIAAAVIASDRWVCAWGNHGAHLGRAADVLSSLLRLAPRAPHFLGRTGRGEPRHPLYLPALTRPRSKASLWSPTFR